MLAAFLVCAMCAGQSVQADSLRQKTPIDSERVLSNSIFTPPLAALLRSAASALPPSQIASNAIDTAAVGLEGYLVARQSNSIFSCDLWTSATPQPLNTCVKDEESTNGEYIRYTAASTEEATQSYYTDSKCATAPKRQGSISLGDCSLFGYSVVYSSTSAPPSTRPFAKVK
jgi:hypothetical protein